jgi:hypothetical protein
LFSCGNPQPRRVQRTRDLGKRDRGGKLAREKATQDASSPTSEGPKRAMKKPVIEFANSAAFAACGQLSIAESGVSTITRDDRARPHHLLDTIDAPACITAYANHAMTARGERNKLRGGHLHRRSSFYVGGRVGYPRSENGQHQRPR